LRYGGLAQQRAPDRMEKQFCARISVGKKTR
jgi:hypothetical protein